MINEFMQYILTNGQGGRVVVCAGKTFFYLRISMYFRARERRWH